MNETKLTAKNLYDAKLAAIKAFGLTDKHYSKVNIERAYGEAENEPDGWIAFYKGKKLEIYQDN